MESSRPLPPHPPFSERSRTMTAEDFTGRARFFSRAASSVRRKMLQTYGLSESDLRIPNILLAAPEDSQFPLTHEQIARFTGTAQERLDAEKAAILRSDKWRETRAEAIAESGLEPESAAALDEAGARILGRYLDAFYLTRLVSDRQDVKALGRDATLYNWGPPRKLLTDIYKNHLSNQTEAELRAVGLDMRSAHLTHAHLVGRAVTAYRTYITNSMNEAALRPNQPSCRNKQHETLMEQVDEMDRYWKIEGRVLDGHYQKHDRAR